MKKNIAMSLQWRGPALAHSETATAAHHHDPAADDHHDSLVAHHFEDLEQQTESAQLGMWLFLAQEIMFFGGLFLLYFVYRTQFYDAWVAGSGHLSVPWGTFNTCVLLCSSLTMAMAVHSAQLGHRNKLIMFLLLTIALGVAFLGVKGIEYADKFEHHLFPGPNFAWAGAEDAAHVQLFYVIYFLMTGMHAFHMVIGVIILSVLTVMAWRNKFSPLRFMPIELTGLYWHFVDIVWVFLFPLLYLVDRTGGAGH